MRVAPTNSPKVLVYQIGSLGDTLVSIPAYRAVRRHFGSSAKIHVLHNIPMDKRATPHQVLADTGLVDGFLGFSQGGGRSTWKTLARLWPRLLRERFDAVVYLAPAERPPGAVRRDRLFFRLCGITQLLGFHAVNPVLFSLRNDSGRPVGLPHEAQMRLDRLRRDGVPVRDAADQAPPLFTVSEDERDAMSRWATERGIDPDRPIVAVCPGANQPAKFWPIKDFIEIGRRLVAEGFQPLVIGGPSEAPTGDEMVAAWGTGVNAAGQFPVMGSAALLSLCQLLVGLDTGTTHLAASVGVPCIALYADRDPPGQWEPLGRGHTVLRHPVPCGGCRLRECNVSGHPCMNGITVDEVWSAISQMALQCGDVNLITP